MHANSFHNLEIEILDRNQNLNNSGSLLKLYRSEYFTLDMLIMYLDKNFEFMGSHDYLINMLYK